MALDIVVIAPIARRGIERNLRSVLPLFIAIIEWGRVKLRILVPRVEIGRESILVARGRTFGRWRKLDGRNIATPIVISIYMNDSLRRTEGRILMILPMVMMIVLVCFQR